MTDNLYRQEALDHQNRRLFGEVILKSPPAAWWMTCLLIAAFLIGLGVLFGVQVETGDGSQRLIHWLMNRSG